MRLEKPALEALSAGARAAVLLAAVLGIGGCGGGGTSGPGTDVTPPVITTAPSTAGLTTARTRIEWVTNEVSNSVVRYGPDTLYAYVSSDVAWLTDHSVWLTTGLRPDSTVHYRVECSDQAGNLTRSADATFIPPHARIFFGPPDTTAASVAGGPVIANLSVGSVSALFFVGATVLFNPALVRCDSVTSGIFLASGGDTVVAASHVDNGLGEASIGLTRTRPQDGVDGGGVLARFHFTPLAPGTSPLTIRTSDLQFQGATGVTMANFDGLVVTDGAITVTP